METYNSLLFKYFILRLQNELQNSISLIPDCPWQWILLKKNVIQTLEAPVSGFTQRALSRAAFKQNNTQYNNSTIITQARAHMSAREGTARERILDLRVTRKRNMTQSRHDVNRNSTSCCCLAQKNGNIHMTATGSERLSREKKRKRKIIEN